MTAKLKPCPFCGAVKKLELGYAGTAYGTRVYCVACGCEGPVSRKQEAGVLWNQRANPVVKKYLTSQKG